MASSSPSALPRAFRPINCTTRPIGPKGVAIILTLLSTTLITIFIARLPVAHGIPKKIEIVKKINTAVWDILKDPIEGMDQFIKLANSMPALKRYLQTEDDFTLFVPTNQAIENRGELNPEQLKATLWYHIVQGEYSYTKLTKSRVLMTMLKDGKFTDLPAGHFQSLIVKPSSDGVELSHGHLPDARVSRSIHAKNGIVHVISTMLLPPSQMPFDAANSALSKMVQLLRSPDGTHDPIRKRTGMTIFVPTTKTYERLERQSDLTELRKVVFSHCVEGEVVFSSDLQQGLVLQSMSGELLTITKKGKIVLVNGIPIITSDIVSSFGVVHVIGNDQDDHEEEHVDPKVPPAPTPSKSGKARLDKDWNSSYTNDVETQTEDEDNEQSSSAKPSKKPKKTARSHARSSNETDETDDDDDASKDEMPDEKSSAASCGQSKIEIRVDYPRKAKSIAMDSKRAKSIDHNDGANKDKKDDCANERAGSKQSKHAATKAAASSSGRRSKSDKPAAPADATKPKQPSRVREQDNHANHAVTLMNAATVLATLLSMAILVF